MAAPDARGDRPAPKGRYAMKGEAIENIPPHRV
jgi:hypothetical protein